MGMNVVINNVEDLYNFGKEKLESTEEKTDHLHHKRTFFLIENIDRNRPDRSKTKTVPGTRKLQCIKSTEEKYSLLTRNLSCFCQVCVDNTADEIQCENSELVDQWTSQELHHTAVGNDVRQTRGRGRNAGTRGARARRGDRGLRNRGGGRTRGEDRDLRIGGGKGVRTRGEERGARTRGEGRDVRIGEGRGIKTRGGRGLRTRGVKRGVRTRGGKSRGVRTRSETRYSSESEESFVEGELIC